MFRKALIVTSLMIAVALLCASAFGAQSSAPVGEGSSRAKFNAQDYSYKDQDGIVGGSTAAVRPSEGVSLGSPSLTSPFVGVKIGDTYSDQQHNGRMTRMVDWGNDVSGGEGFMVHFEWMRQATEVQENSHYSYNVYYAGGSQTGTMLGQTTIQPNGEYAGYVSLDVTNDGRAVLGGHNNQGSGTQAHIYWDFGPGFAFFGMNRRVPDSVMAAGTGQDVNDSLKSAMWPSIRYQEHPSDENLNVTHVFTQVSELGAGDGQAIIYFRKVGDNDLGEWDYPPYVVDTVFDIAQDVACSNVDGKVALVWIANLPDPGDCDTCSSQTGRPFVQWDNDVYYQTSDNYGAPGSWQPRVNATQNVDGIEGYRPYTDLQALITTDNSLHIVWGSRFWPADANSGGQAGLLRGRIFHFGENLGVDNLRTAATAEYDQTYCNGGAWQLNASKMSISECDGKLFVLWTQFNDPEIMMNDCHNRALTGTDFAGAANGELYLAVSDDDGLTWDKARNLTNTHTPACDSSSGTGGECRSEHWASMNRHGTNLTGDMSGAFVLDPSEGYSGDYFLDVQYIGDKDPGSVIQDEGTWQRADVMWFRLPCIEPVPSAIFAPSWNSIDYPAHTQHGVPVDTPLVIENRGNIDLNVTLTIEEDGAPFGAIVLSGGCQGGVTIPAGVNNTLECAVTLNAGGVVNSPGTIVHLTGRLIAVGNQVTSPDTLSINLWVVDTLYAPNYDTISTGCISLIVSNNGNMGRQGAGRVNMDFFDNGGECDDLEGYLDSIPGDATVYLYDASPVICWTDASDTVRCNWSVYGDGYLSEHGFVPMGHVPPVDMGDYELYETRFVTRDTGIMFEKLLYAPKTSPGSCSFMVQHLRVFALDGQTHTGLNIGEVIDWDIPADSGKRNRSGFDAGNRLVYQFGSEYNEDDDVECQENDDRYGGIALLAIVKNGVATTNPYGAFTADNSTWVYPTGGLVPSELDSLMSAREGYVMSDSLDADLFSVMTFLSNHTLSPTDTVDIYTLLTTGRNGFAEFMSSVWNGHDWYSEYIDPDSGVVPWVCGDIDGSGSVDMSDMVYLVDYLFTGGPPGLLLGAELDGHQLWTLADWSMLYQGFLCYQIPLWEMNCPDSVGPPLGQTLTPDVVLYLADYRFPANATSITLDVWVDTDPGLKFAVMPFNVRVGGEIPAANLTIVHESFGQNARDSVNGVVQVDMFVATCPPSTEIGAGSYHVAQLQLVMPTSSPSDRDVVIAWDSLVTNEVHYPFVVMSDNSDWRPTIKTSGPCCVGAVRGNVDCDSGDEIDIADLVWMVDYMFNGWPLCCYDETDFNGDGTIDIADLVCMVEYMFSNPSECFPEACTLSGTP